MLTRWLKMTATAAMLFAASGALADELTIREVSTRTFSGTINDDKDHPVLVIDDLKNPRPIGPGRGAGGYVFLNNKLLDWKSGKEIGVMHGMCFTLDHGPDGPFTGRFQMGAGGPFPSSCQITYRFPDGQLVGTGIIDLNAMEKDEKIPLPIVGGTGKYSGARGEVIITQDPPGQPMTYKVTLKYKLR